MKRDSSHLLPCPFCGGMDILMYVFESNKHESGSTDIECQNKACGGMLSIPGDNTGEEGSTAWNKRVTGGEPVAWISKYGLRRIAKNTGVLSKVSFKENLSRLENEVQDIPLYRKNEA